MEDKRMLNEEELEKINGGVSFNVNGNKLEILLEPNESAEAALREKLQSGIQVYGFSLAVEDPNNYLMNAAQKLDILDNIGISRKCTVVYALEGLTKVIVKSVTYSF